MITWHEKVAQANIYNDGKELRWRIEGNLEVGVHTKYNFLSANYNRIYEYTIYLDDFGQFLGDEGGEKKLTIEIKHK